MEIYSLLKEVDTLLASKALVVNGRGIIAVEGVPITGVDGQRTLKMFAEGVLEDQSQFGSANTIALYRCKFRTPDGLGHALRASQRFARELDSEDVGNV